MFRHEKTGKADLERLNYMALTDLVPELMQMVDDKKIALTPAYQIATLTQDEQRLLVDTIDSEVKSVRAPCRLMASYFILMAFAFSLTGVFSRWILESTMTMT